MAVKIPGFAPEDSIPRSYEDLFDQLRKAPRFNTLGVYQSSALKQFDENRNKHQDIAIPLPTGRGKTLVALFIGRMHQMRTKKRVLYICPNKQLVKQVEAEAADLGIQARNIAGSWRDNAEPSKRVNAEARELYTRNKCIGIATYQSLFNVNPLIPEADLIILDDAHAAGEAVAAPWVLELDRAKQAALFKDIDALLAKHVEKVQRLALGPKPTPGTREAQLVPHRSWLRIVDDVEKILGEAEPDALGEAQYPWRLLKGRLDRAFCFLGPNTITIRAWSPPSFQNALFAEAKHRVYFSATVEEWGHLEHIFGISTIKTLQSSSGTTVVKEPGRRLIVTAQQLYPDLSDEERVSRLVALSPKNLVLVSSMAARDRLVNGLKVAGVGGIILASSAVEEDIDRFKSVTNATLVLANRYDGLNLGRGICRHIIICGKPTAVNVQEEFTTNEWGLLKAGTARARERILQGMGRCTRSNDDYCLVSLVGQDLASFLHDVTIRDSLPPRIRAELRLGETTIEGLAGENPDDTLKSWIQDNASWAGTHAKYDNEQAAKPMPEQLQKGLQEINRAESRYNEYLWTRKYDLAEELAQKTAHKMEKADMQEEAAPWYYLASVPADNQEHVNTGSMASSTGFQMLRLARSRGVDRDWFGYLERHMQDKPKGEVDDRQAEGIVAFLQQRPEASHRLTKENAEALDQLRKEEPRPFHAALRHLGSSLGFKVGGDQEDGASDCVWHLGSTVYFNFEAKTQKTNDCLSQKEVNQIKGQLADIAANDGLVVPPDLKTVCVTDCTTIASRKEHDLDKFDVARPATVLEFATAWFGKLEEIVREGTKNRADLKAAVAIALINHGATLTSLAQSLKIQPAEAVIHVGAKVKMTA